MGDPLSQAANHDLLTKILSTLQSMQSDYRQLSTAVDTIDRRVNILAEIKQINDTSKNRQDNNPGTAKSKSSKDDRDPVKTSIIIDSPALLVADRSSDSFKPEKPLSTGRISGSANPSRIILTTYAGQSGIDPVAMNWGNPDPVRRGPVVVSRSQSTVGRRNGMRIMEPTKITYSDIPS